MNRSYSTLSFIGIATMLCTNALIGCIGGGSSTGGVPFSGTSIGGRRTVTPITTTPSLPIVSPPILVEEFIYPPTTGIDGLNGGTGWGGPWFNNTGWSITAPGLSHPVQTSNTIVTGNNKATPVTSTADVSATRSVSAASVTLINNALNSVGGVWFRYLVFFPAGNTGTQSLTAGFDATNLEIDVTAGTPGNLSFTLGGTSGSASPTIPDNSTYMIIGNLFKSNSSSGNFTLKIWLLPSTLTTFSLSSTPTLTDTTTTPPFGPLPVNISAINVSIGDTVIDSIDEIYAANSAQGLAINVSP